MAPSPTCRTGCLMGALQFPIEALQRTERFISANRNLAVFAVTGTHRDGDAVEFLFDGGKIIMKLRFLLAR